MLQVKIVPLLEKLRQSVYDSGLVVEKDADAFFHGVLAPDLMQVVTTEFPRLFLEAIEPMVYSLTDQERQVLDTEKAKLDPLWSVRCYDLEGMREAACGLDMAIEHLVTLAEREEREELLNLPGALESGEPVVLRNYAPADIGIKELRCLGVWVRTGNPLPSIGSTIWEGILSGEIRPAKE